MMYSMMTTKIVELMIVALLLMSLALPGATALGHQRNESNTTLIAGATRAITARNERLPNPTLLWENKNNTKPSLRRIVNREDKEVRHSYDYSPKEIMPMLSPQVLKLYKLLGCDDLKRKRKNTNAPCQCSILRATPFDQDAIDIQKANRREEEIITNAPCINGLAAGKWPCKNIDLKANLPLSVFRTSDEPLIDEAGGYMSVDLWGWTHQASGREFSINGVTDGMAFVEITDPSNPIYWGKLSLDMPYYTIWGDIKVYKNHAFLVMEYPTEIGMVVFDLTRLLSPRLQPGTIFGPDALYEKAGYSHNIAINERTGYAYLLGTDRCRGGLHMVDIRNPKNPKYAGCYNDAQGDGSWNDGYTHDAQCVIYNGPHRMFAGREICFLCNEDTVTIVDVTNKRNTIELSRTFYPDTQYTHQGWLSSDHRYFVFGDEGDEEWYEFNTRTMVLDVSNLRAPTNYQEFYGPTPAIDHNQYIVKGRRNRDLTYQANYHAGLQVYEIMDYSTANFDLVGFFDIYPADDNADFNGAWSVYPYFPSGNVVVSGISEGLFVLQPTFASAIRRGNGGGRNKGKGKGKGMSKKGNVFGKGMRMGNVFGKGMRKGGSMGNSKGGMMGMRY